MPTQYTQAEIDAVAAQLNAGTVTAAELEAIYGVPASEIEANLVEYNRQNQSLQPAPDYTGLYGGDDGVVDVFGDVDLMPLVNTLTPIQQPSTSVASAGAAVGNQLASTAANTVANTVTDTATGSLFNPAVFFYNFVKDFKLFHSKQDYPKFDELPPQEQADIIYNNFLVKLEQGGGGLGGEDTEGAAATNPEMAGAVYETLSNMEGADVTAMLTDILKSQGDAGIGMLGQGVLDVTDPSITDTGYQDENRWIYQGGGTFKNASTGEEATADNTAGIPFIVGDVYSRGGDDNTDILDSNGNTVAGTTNTGVGVSIIPVSGTTDTGNTGNTGGAGGTGGAGNTGGAGGAGDAGGTGGAGGAGGTGVGGDLEPAYGPQRGTVSTTPTPTPTPTPGKDGANGKDGTDGKDGDKGDTGARGARGLDGTAARQDMIAGMFADYVPKWKNQIEISTLKRLFGAA